jgi:hypothetical protein
MRPANAMKREAFAAGPRFGDCANGVATRE